MAFHSILWMLVSGLFPAFSIWISQAQIRSSNKVLRSLLSLSSLSLSLSLSLSPLSLSLSLSLSVFFPIPSVFFRALHSFCLPLFSQCWSTVTPRFLSTPLPSFPSSLLLSFSVCPLLDAIPNLLSGQYYVGIHYSGTYFTIICILY